MEQLETDADEALHEHILRTAQLGRQRHAPFSTLERLQPLLADRNVVRYPVEVVFAADPLQADEFACADLIGKTIAEGFRLSVHPHYEGHASALPILIAYHIPSINYGPIVTAEHAEAFGSTLLGMDAEVYYQRVCALADLIPS